MRRRISMYPTGHAYLGKAVADDGYVGDVDAEFNAVTITLVKPGTSPGDVVKSLLITIESVKLNAGQQNNTKTS